jgi:hypothetical protein
MGEPWKQMTPEERDKFRQRIHACWSRVASPDSKASAWAQVAGSVARSDHKELKMAHRVSVRCTGTLPYFSFWQEDTMIRERALKVVLVLVGSLFLAGLYPLTQPNQPEQQMLGGVYATLGIFLLLALRNTSANRSLIAFTAWSSLVHAAIMAVQAFRNVIPRGDLLGAVLPLAIVGVALIVLAPEKVRLAGSWSQYGWRYFRGWAQHLLN